MSFRIQELKQKCLNCESKIAALCSHWLNLSLRANQGLATDAVEEERLFKTVSSARCSDVEIVNRFEKINLFLFVEKI